MDSFAESTAAPSRIRYSIVLLALLINLTSYVDRVCISVAAPAIRSEFGLTPVEMGLVFSVFSLAYFLFLTPWGMLADRYGARSIVALAIFWWSVFTSLTAAAWNFISLVTVRFLFGALEAGLTPAVASAFTRWVPESERSTAFGAFLSGGRIGGAVTPALAAVLLLRYGWRPMFLAFAAFGVLWCFVWYAWYRESPREHPRTNAAERQLLADACPARPGESLSWRQTFQSRPLLLLLGVAFGYTFMWQFYITWFPTYLIEKRGLSLAEAAGFSGLPFLFGVAANWAGGIATDALSRRYGVSWGRGFLGFCSLLVSAALLVAGIALPHPRQAAVLIALAAGAGDMMLGAIWASAVSIGGRAAGAVSGLMNAASNAAGFVSPALMGWILQLRHDWNTVLLAGAAMNVVAAFLWTGVNRPARREAHTRPGQSS